MAKSQSELLEDVREFELLRATTSERGGFIGEEPGWINTIKWGNHLFTWEHNTLRKPSSTSRQNPPVHTLHRTEKNPEEAAVCKRIDR